MNEWPVTDVFVRRLTQSILTVSLFALLALRLSFPLFLISRKLDFLDQIAPWNQVALTTLELPF